MGAHTCKAHTAEVETGDRETLHNCGYFPHFSLLCVCTHVCPCMSAVHMWRSEDELAKVGSLLPPCGSQGST